MPCAFRKWLEIKLTWPSGWHNTVNSTPLSNIHSINKSETQPLSKPNGGHLQSRRLKLGRKSHLQNAISNTKIDLSISHTFQTFFRSSNRKSDPNGPAVTQMYLRLFPKAYSTNINKYAVRTHFCKQLWTSFQACIITQNKMYFPSDIKIQGSKSRTKF